MNKWAKMSQEDKEYGRESVSEIEDISFIGESETKQYIFYRPALLENFDLEDYQNKSRIYLDEYEGQEELRKDWFKNNKDIYFENRWIRRN
jgi:hypothetical protein